MAQSRLVRLRHGQPVSSPGRAACEEPGLYGRGETGGVGLPTRRCAGHHSALSTTDGAGTDRTHHEPLLSSDPAAPHRYGLYSTHQTGSTPPLAIPCAGRCGGTAATSRRLSYRHIRQGPRGPLAVGGFGLSRTDSDVAEGRTAMAGDRRRHSRSLARRGSATLAAQPGSISTLPGRAGGTRRYDTVSRSGDLRCLWVHLP